MLVFLSIGTSSVISSSRKIVSANDVWRDLCFTRILGPKGGELVMVGSGL